MWLVMTVMLMAAAFVVPVTRWWILAAAGFGIPEGFAIWDGQRRYPDRMKRHLAPYPPLTYVTRYYLPRWLAYTLTGGLVGAIGSSWFVTHPSPWLAAAVFGLFSWLIEHWEVTYRMMPEPE
jgi:hypothetical protein